MEEVTYTCKIKILTKHPDKQFCKAYDLCSLWVYVFGQGEGGCRMECSRMMGEGFIEDTNLVVKGQVRLSICGHWELLNTYVQRVKRLRLHYRRFILGNYES